MENISVRLTQDNYDYNTSGPGFVSDASRYILGEYHDPFNIGQTVEILFDGQPGQGHFTLLGQLGDGGVWTSDYWRGLDVLHSNLITVLPADGILETGPGYAAWSTIGEEIAALNSGAGKALQYQIDGHRLILSTGLDDEISAPIADVNTSRIEANNSNAVGIAGKRLVANENLYPSNYVQRAFGD